MISTASGIISESILYDTKMVKDSKCKVGTCGCLDPYSQVHEYYASDDDCGCSYGYRSDCSESNMCNCFFKHVPDYHSIDDIPNETIKQILEKNEDKYEEIIREVCISSSKKGLKLFQETYEKVKCNFNKKFNFRTSYDNPVSVEYKYFRLMYNIIYELPLKKINIKELLQIMYLISVDKFTFINEDYFEELLKKFAYRIIIMNSEDVVYFKNFFQGMLEDFKRPSFFLKNTPFQDSKYIETKDKRLNALITYYEKYLKGSSDDSSAIMIDDTQPVYIQILKFLFGLKYDFKKAVEKEIKVDYVNGGKPTMFYLHSVVHNNAGKQVKVSCLNFSSCCPVTFYKFVDDEYVIYEDNKFSSTSSKLSKSAQKFQGIFNTILLRYEHNDCMIAVLKYFVNHAFVTYTDCEYLSKKLDELWKFNVKRREYQKKLSSILTKRINDINNNF